MARGTETTRLILTVLSLLSVGCTHGAPEAGSAKQLPTTPPSRDTHERLHGVLWTQTSGEFWALTATTYREAEALLGTALKNKRLSAALEQTGTFIQLPPAVVLDLDETVLDNSRFQGRLVTDRTDYLQPTWDQWVDKMDAGLLPGALNFISQAAARGVKVFFITNRTAAEQVKTLKNLEALGIAASDETVLCTGENGWTSDKSDRRAEVAKTHRILLLIGDDMNDFVSIAKMNPDQRLELAKTHEARWGRTWILIPNPTYGSWERSLYPGISNDPEVLAKKRSLVKDFQ